MFSGHFNLPHAHCLLDMWELPFPTSRLLDTRILYENDDVSIYVPKLIWSSLHGELLRITLQV